MIIACIHRVGRKLDGDIEKSKIGIRRLSNCLIQSIYY